MNEIDEFTLDNGHNFTTTMNVLDTESMPAGKFKAHCLELMDRTKLKKTAVIVTKHGRPVAKLVPVDETGPELFGFLAWSVTYHGEIVSPTD